MALAAAVFATSGFAGQLTISEGGKLTLNDSATVDVSTNSGTIEIAAGKVLTDATLNNEGSIVFKTGSDSYGQVAGNIEQGWEKDAVKGGVSFIPSINLAYDANDSSWTPTLQALLGDGVIEAKDGDAVKFKLSKDGFVVGESTKTFESAAEINSFLRSLGISNVTGQYTAASEFLDLIQATSNDPIALDADTTQAIGQAINILAAISGTNSLTFTGNYGITIKSDLSELTGTLTTAGDLTFANEDDTALPGGDFVVGGTLTIAKAGLELANTATVHGLALNQNFTIANGGELKIEAATAAPSNPEDDEDEPEAVGE